MQQKIKYGVVVACLGLAQCKLFEKSTSDINSYRALPIRALPEDLNSSYKFELLTPTGEKIFRNSIKWESIQITEPSYPKAAKCAANVTKVMALSGLEQYRGESVGGLLKSIVDNNGRFFKFSKDKTSIIKKLNDIYGGNLPVGTIVGGCLYSDCSAGKKGQRHAAMVGDIDSDGNILLYHNNWYRPDNEGGHRKQYMVSDFFIRNGFPRQWMPTPWIKLKRDDSGKVIDVKAILPAIDDLDPFQYFFSIAIPSEIVTDIANSKTNALSLTSQSTLPESDIFDIIETGEDDI